jgi:hypothetical protein
MTLTQVFLDLLQASLNQSNKTVSLDLKLQNCSTLPLDTSEGNLRRLAISLANFTGSSVTQLCTETCNKT